MKGTSLIPFCLADIRALPTPVIWGQRMPKGQRDWTTWSALLGVSDIREGKVEGTLTEALL